MDNVRHMPDHGRWAVVRIYHDPDDEADDPFYTMYGILLRIQKMNPDMRVWISAYGLLNPIYGSRSRTAHKTISANSVVDETIRRNTKVTRAASTQGATEIEERALEIFEEVYYYTVMYRE